MAIEDINVKEADRTAHQHFVMFMASVVKFQDLGKKGAALFSGFHQELELSRRASLNDSSSLLSKIFDENQNERLRNYVKAGCRHFHMDTLSVIKLNSSLQGLRNSVQEANHILKTLKQLLDAMTGLMQETTISMLAYNQVNREENSVEGYGSGNEEESAGNNLQIPDFVMMMSIIFNMLKQDYDMQEKVVSDTLILASSNVLESYALMWNLHPFIDERIIDRAVLWV